MASIRAVKPTILIVIVMVVTGLTYVRTLGFDFVYDDQPQIVYSTIIRSWSDFPYYFTTHVWEHWRPGAPGIYYRPVFLSWLLLNYKLFALAPLGWHLTTLATHLAATLLLYLLALRLTASRVTAALSALLFGVHPVHLESVAWVSGVTEPLLAVFVLGSFWSYLKGRVEPKPNPWRVVSLFLCAAALGEKESAVMFPAAIFGFEWIFTGSSSRERFRTAVRSAEPYCVLTACYFAVRILVLHGLRFSAAELSPAAAALTAPSAILFYIKRLLWPVGTSPFYDLPVVAKPGFADFVLPMLIVGAFAVLVYICCRRSRTAAFAAMWMILMLLPVLNLRGFPPESLVHDRYLYLPSVGFCLLLALAFRRIDPACYLNAVGGGVNRTRLGAGQSYWQRAILAVPPLVLIFLFAVTTVAQSPYWKDNLVLFQRGVSIAPKNWLAKHMLAVELGRVGLYQEAIPLLQEVLEISPRTFEPNLTIGTFYYRTGAFAGADVYLSRALEIEPNITRLPYAYLGLARAELGRLDDAESAIRRGMAIKATRTIDGDDTIIRAALSTVLARKKSAGLTITPSSP